MSHSPWWLAGIASGATRTPSVPASGNFSCVQRMSVLAPTLLSTERALGHETPSVFVETTQKMLRVDEDDSYGDSIFSKVYRPAPHPSSRARLACYKALPRHRPSVVLRPKATHSSLDAHRTTLTCAVASRAGGHSGCSRPSSGMAAYATTSGPSSLLSPSCTVLLAYAR
ncbi:hypothetical protein HMN09_00849500 [Mycena chlorophos]|uniref:Uncharacterized protein n=1 Tax=Mycena chlorophos TaxID=658473 RepID=A0A8H6W4C3_MYCCL|nr:hypothetical protein HMN09_00849500 [Mycena chlorophos]